LEEDETDDPCEIDFNIYDDENDGIMTLEEFKHFFDDRCALCPQDYAEELLAMFDHDMSGDLDLTEFCDLWEYVESLEDDDDDVTPSPPDPDNDDDDDDRSDAQRNFDNWVYDQQIPEDVYYCSMDVSTNWHNGYYFFAGHDCDIYDLTLSVMAKKTDWDDKQLLMSSDAQMIGDCEEIGVFDRLCKFFLTPDNPKLGIAFDADAEVDLYYETEWTHCID
jgi:hypothetical protein